MAGSTVRRPPNDTGVVVGRTMVIRVVIVHDAPLYREGLAHALAKFEDIGIEGTAANGDEVLTQIPDHQPDVILVHSAVPGNTAALRAIADAVPTAKVIILGTPDTEEDIVACAEAGASGYVLQNESLDHLATTIRAVVRGEVMCSPRIAATLFRRVGELAAERHSWAAQAHLTPRELEIVKLIDQQLSNKEIAQRLSIEVRTVKNHVHNILDKLQVHHRREAAAWMREAVYGTTKKNAPERS